MTNNLVTNLYDVCTPLLLDSFNGSLAILYYSHIPSIIISLVLGTLVLVKGGNKILSRVFFLLTSLFIAWLILDLFTWLSVNSGVIMFTWSITTLVEPLIFIATLYFVYVYIEQKDARLLYKVLAGVILLPLIIMIPTQFNLSAFSATECYAVENNYSLYYKYGIEILFTLVLIIFSLVKIKYTNEHLRRQWSILLLGVLLFLLSFFSAVFLGGYLADNGFNVSGYNVETYGIFGGVVFMVFITYLIVKYKAFDIKILGTQALVVALMILVGSQFFYVKTQVNFVLTIITFVLVVSAGILLIQSFKRSEERKEELQIMADRLAVSNDRLRELDRTKTEFISIASHQLRTPLTSIKGYCALMLEGLYGDVSQQMEEIINRIIFSNDRLVNLVENLLNISRMEAGRMEYVFEEHRLEDILSELKESFAFAARSKEVTLTLNFPQDPLPPLKMDKQKIQEVFSNLMDNAIKYTNKGDVTVTLDQNPVNHRTRVTVKDSGIGIPASEIPYLFAKFSRGKDINRLHASGTGLGLYVAKNIVEAHKGTIRIESEGEGKGTSFIVELG